MSFITSNALPIALGLRGVQIVFAAILISTAYYALSMDRYYVTVTLSMMGMVSGGFSLLFYVPLLVPCLVLFHTPAVVLAGEIFTWIWWLTAFGCEAFVFSYNSYDSVMYYGGSGTAWKAGIAELAFGVLGWVFSSITLMLVVVYSIIPASKSQGCRITHYYALGGIFPRLTEAPGRADSEAVVGTESEAIKTTVHTERRHLGTCDVTGGQFDDTGYPMELADPVHPVQTR